MNQNEIKDAINRNMDKQGLKTEDVRIQPDPFEGWRIIVIASGFEGKQLYERKSLAMSGLENLKVAWLELLTPLEQEWAGSLPLDSDLKNLPLWPEALSRTKVEGQPAPDIIFPSDLDEDLDRPVIVTFYSMRGGVGRSTALAYTAKILASRGRKVLCVDMDLEAPGLTALFGQEKDIEEGQGLVHLLVALDRGENPDLSKHLLRISETDDLYCLPAGLPDANYARLLNFIDPSAWYREERNPLRDLFDRLAKSLPFKPDVIFVDSRTGITSMSGPLLFDLADLSVVVFFPHPQTVTATAALVRALLFAKTRRLMNGRKLTPEPRFLVSPVPASKAPEVIRRYEHRSLEWIAEWLSMIGDSRNGDTNLVESEITHFVPYREVVATSDQILSDREVWRDYEPVAEWVERFLPSPSEEQIPKSLSGLKDKILAELRFSGGTAEHQEKEIFRNTFVETDLVKKAIDPSIPLILGRKGTGKTAIFRHFLIDCDKPSVVVLAPSQLCSHGWLLGADGFSSVDDSLAKNSLDLDWRPFWTIYTFLACYYQCPLELGKRPLPDQTFANRLEHEPATQLDTIRLFEEIITIPQFGLLINDWLVRFDKTTTQTIFLLFDNLDTGFGSSNKDRDRRRRAIEGLFAFLTDQGDRFQRLRFKIVLREDIWRQLKFENKSHLFGRSVTLKWSDKSTYFKVVIKQALQSVEFKGLLSSAINYKDFTSLDSWSESEVFKAWNILVGERMKGSGSAFTRNWVWNRLADGNGDHSPRYLLQLLHKVTDWEKEEHTKTTYDKSIIRPRALIQSLPAVSEQALSALSQEEFPELKELLDKLREIRRTPIEAEDLSGLEEQVSLAREVGLLRVYEGTDEKVERYQVPDIYRHALGLTRKGQA